MQIQVYININLRSRGHGLILSVIPSEFMRKNFINRMLFNDDIQCESKKVAPPPKTFCDIFTCGELV